MDGLVWRQTMTFKVLAIALAVTSLVGITAAAAKRHHVRHGHPVHSTTYPQAAYPVPGAADQPRMYQARPGVWISTWDCIIDEGNGRWLPCSVGGASGRM
jgi:hypothetical protein